MRARIHTTTTATTTSRPAACPWYAVGVARQLLAAAPATAWRPSVLLLLLPPCACCSTLTSPGFVCAGRAHHGRRRGALPHAGAKLRDLLPAAPPPVWDNHAQGGGSAASGLCSIPRRAYVARWRTLALAAPARFAACPTHPHTHTPTHPHTLTPSPPSPSKHRGRTFAGPVVDVLHVLREDGGLAVQPGHRVGGEPVHRCFHRRRRHPEPPRRLVYHITCRAYPLPTTTTTTTTTHTHTPHPASLQLVWRTGVVVFGSIV